MKKKAMLLTLSAILLSGAIGGAFSASYLRDDLIPIRAEGEVDANHLGEAPVQDTIWEGESAKQSRVEISLKGVTFEGTNVVLDIAAIRAKLNTFDYIYVNGKKLSEIATEEALKGVVNPYGINLWERKGILLYIPGLTADKDGHYARPNQLVIKKGCQLPATAPDKDGNFKYYTVAQDAGWGLDAVLDTESSGDITVKESVNDLGTPTPFYSGFSGSKWQIGGEMIAPGKGKDNYIMLFFEGGDYGDKATYTLPDGNMDYTKATNAIDTSQIKKAGTFEHIYIDGVKLASIEGIYSAEKYYNLWTIWGVVAFKVPTLEEGAIVKEIKIDAGTKFPKRVQDDPTKVKYYTVPKETIVKTKYIMHFMNDDGTEEWDKKILGFGDPVTPPEAPAKKGYVFDHWEDADGKAVTDFVLDEKTGNVTYYGVYKKNADPTPTSSEQPTPTSSEQPTSTSSEQPTPQSSSSGGTAKKKKGGCGGSIGGSLVGASFGLLGLGLLVFKRRKKEK